MRFLLFPFAALYWLVTEIKNLFYDFGFIKPKKVKTPVICVGNLTTGGTGKTPWVQYICQYLESKNKKVAIVSRGYGGEYEGILKVESHMDAKLCGDEPLWLAKNTKASVFLSKNRYLGALQAIKESYPDVIILDDGYQHRKFHRDLDIVLLDASAASRSYWLLPVGYLREAFRHIKRSKAVVVNKCNYADEKNLLNLLTQCKSHISEAQLWKSDFLFKEWQSLFSSLHQSFKNENNISICCGLGNPEAFVKTVKSQNFQPIEMFIFPDHFYWRPRDIEKMTYQMKNRNSYDLMVTEKDAVKLSRYEKHFKEMGIQLWVCKMKIEIKENQSSFFQEIDNVLKT